MGSCCGYTKTEQSKTIFTGASQKHQKETEIEDTLQGLKQEEECQRAKQGCEKSMVKKTSIQNFEEIVGVLQNSPDIQIIEHQTEEQRVSFLDPITNQEIEIQLKEPIQTQKSKEEIIQDIKEHKVASIIVSEKVNDNTLPTSNENNNLVQSKVTR